jgi:hypothetical protein
MPLHAAVANAVPSNKREEKRVIADPSFFVLQKLADGDVDAQLAGIRAVAGTADGVIRA